MARRRGHIPPRHGAGQGQRELRLDLLLEGLLLPAGSVSHESEGTRAGEWPGHLQSRRTVTITPSLTDAPSWERGLFTVCPTLKAHNRTRFPARGKHLLAGWFKVPQSQAHFFSRQTLLVGNSHTDCTCIRISASVTSPVLSGEVLSLFQPAESPPILKLPATPRERGLSL